MENDWKFSMNEDITRIPFGHQPTFFVVYSKRCVMEVICGYLDENDELFFESASDAEPYDTDSILAWMKLPNFPVGPMEPEDAKKHAKKYLNIQRNKMSITIPVPTYCFKISKRKLKFYNGTPESYELLLDVLEKLIFKNNTLTEEEGVEFFPRLDFLLMEALKGETVPGNTGIYHGRDVEVYAHKDDIYITVREEKELLISGEELQKSFDAIQKTDQFFEIKESEL